MDSNLYNLLQQQNTELTITDWIDVDKEIHGYAQFVTRSPVSPLRYSFNRNGI